MRKVCQDVQVESILLQISEDTNETTSSRKKSKVAKKSRLDISGRRIWKSCEKIIFYISLSITKMMWVDLYHKSITEFYVEIFIFSIFLGLLIKCIRCEWVELYKYPNQALWI